MQLDELLDHGETNSHTLLRATRPRSACRKISKMCGRNDESIPCPLSLTCQNNLFILFFESEQ